MAQHGAREHLMTTDEMIEVMRQELSNVHLLISDGFYDMAAKRLLRAILPVMREVAIDSLFENMGRLASDGDRLRARFDEIAKEIEG